MPQPLWILVTSSLDRNLINLRCACGTCAETKKNVLDCTREPPCWNLDSLCTRCVLLSVAVPFCSVTVRSLWLSIRRLKSINSVLWFTQPLPVLRNRIETKEQRNKKSVLPSLPFKMFKSTRIARNAMIRSSVKAVLRFSYSLFQAFT